MWKRRYQEINDWERYLSDNGFRIVKLFLNVSKEEQRTRFLRRIDLPDHNWKFSTADVRERERWDDYQQAFSEVLSHTSTEWAPWYVIPADRKWFGRIGAGAVLAHALMDIDPASPRSPSSSARRCSRSKQRSRPKHRRAPRPTRSKQNTKLSSPEVRTTGRRNRSSREGFNVATSTEPRPERSGDTRAWYGVSPAETMASLGVDSAVGLSSDRAARAA